MKLAHAAFFRRKDHASAWRYVRKAAAQGSAAAMLQLGFCMYHGYSKIDPMAPVRQHVAQDKPHGLEWLRLVATRAADDSLRKQAASEFSKVGFKVDPGWYHRKEWAA